MSRVYVLNIGDDKKSFFQQYKDDYYHEEYSKHVLKKRLYVISTADV
jgi:hypothetical protein